jgi:hypothetical protein
MAALLPFLFIYQQKKTRTKENLPTVTQNVSKVNLVLPFPE